MTDPGLRLFTVEVVSDGGQEDEDSLEFFAQSLTEAGVMDPAVLIYEGRLSCTAQVEASTAADAFVRFIKGWTGVNLSSINIYEGEPPA